jgi:RNA-dependent RNA polymerase
MGDWQDQPNWYGGKIQQILRLVPQETADPGAYKSKQSAFRLHLDEMEMGRSYRFARFLGSRRLLQLKVPKMWEVDWESLKQLLMQKFVLCGRVFVALAVKERKLYFVETDEDYDRDPKPSEGDQYRMSLEELIDWYNPMALNQKQVG